MLDDIGKVDSVARPELLKISRDRKNNQGSSQEQPPPANPENTAQKEGDEDQSSAHLLDVRI
jgi:hypothetical protein